MIQVDIVNRRTLLTGASCDVMTAVEAITGGFSMKKRIVSLLLLAAMVLGGALGLTSSLPPHPRAEISV